MLQDRHIAFIAIIGLILVQISLVGCSLINNASLNSTHSKNLTADWHDPTPVNMIKVDQLRGSHFELATIIDSRDKINLVVEYVNRFSQGWKPVLTTVPSGKLYIAFREDGNSSKFPLFYIRVCSTGIITDINSKTCSRDISQAELKQLIAVLDLKSDAFDEVE